LDQEKSGNPALNFLTGAVPLPGHHFFGDFYAHSRSQSKRRHFRSKMTTRIYGSQIFCAWISDFVPTYAQMAFDLIVATAAALDPN
jgi:hypothetical protein